MTPRERFLACMHFEPVDRPLLWEWHPWPSAVRRWQREGLGDGKYPPQFAECENRTPCGVDLWMVPHFEVKVIAEDEYSVTEQTERGTILRQLKDPDAMSMPEHVAYPVKARADWDAIRDRFHPDDARRFPANWREQCAQWRRDGTIVITQGARSPSLFGFVRELMGPERALYAFCDEPDLVHDMMETYTEFLLGLLPRVFEEAPIAALYFWEDMCYRSGPLISPAMFRRFMVPRYKRVTELARAHGIDIVFVDSDGNTEELIPLWIEAGVNGNYPLEVAAGMDPWKLHRQYGKNLLMHGGIDKRALARGRRAIDRELKAKIPLVEKGGYVPHIDHAIPHDVSYENFVYYWKRKKEMLGLA